ncbi:MAG: FO synthase subunit 1 [Methanonatronarchaeales archaeon]|nr:FO synthase subunit 1 [Methanonatronarchaeales archaeon]
MGPSPGVLEEARRIRDRNHRCVTFARNVFVPLTRVCRNRCSYCGFRKDDVSRMAASGVEQLLADGAEAGCTEALFTFGERPWELAGEREEFVKYLREALVAAIDAGLVPHTNPGAVPVDVLQRIAQLNGSVGAMLESTAELEVHEESPGKRPSSRVSFIDEAMSIGVPFTSGILVGIGESWRDREESLETLKALHERHSTLQEVIVQNLVPPPGSGLTPPSRDEFLRTVSLARKLFPAVSVQAPPNLADPGDLLDAGVDDFGGIGPVTEDHVNPGTRWPEFRELRRECEERGLELRERLAIHPRFVRAKAYPDRVSDVVEELADCEGYRRQP